MRIGRDQFLVWVNYSDVNIKCKAIAQKGTIVDGAAQFALNLPKQTTAIDRAAERMMKGVL